MNAVITLTTDFGTTDPFVGMMKGVILSINPNARIVDLTHYIPPQSIIQAGWTIRTVFRYFPSGTIHVVVVDPGVGTDRRVAALQVGGHIFLAPDNGVLSSVLDEEYQDAQVYEVADSRFFLPEVSHTFHGRDIFAPVAGHLSAGARLSDLGPRIPVHDLVRRPFPQPTVGEDRTVYGIILAIDHFGNLITNIDTHLMNRIFSKEEVGRLKVRIHDQEISGLSQNYQGVKLDELLVLFGSAGYLEISVHAGNAAARLDAQIGDDVRVTATPQ